MDTQIFLNLISIIAILFLLLVTGFICRRTRVIDDAASNRLSKLIIYVAQPMMIVGALVSKEFTPALLKEGMLFLVLGFILHPFMALVAFACGKLYGNADQQKLGQFATIFTNCGFIGFPILNAVFPGKGAFYGAFFIIGFYVYLWSLGILILARGRNDIRLTPKKALINLGTVPCAIGFLLYLSKSFVTIPAFAVDFCNYLGNLSLPVSVLVTGALLAKQSPKDMLTNARLYVYNAIKLLFMPLVVCATVKLCTLGMANSYEIVMFCTVIAGLPSAATVSMLAELYGISPGYAAQTVGSSSLLSVATLPLLYFVGDLIAKI